MRVCVGLSVWFGRWHANLPTHNAHTHLAHFGHQWACMCAFPVFIHIVLYLTAVDNWRCCPRLLFHLDGPNVWPLCQLLLPLLLLLFLLLFWRQEQRRQPANC